MQWCKMLARTSASQLLAPSTVLTPNGRPAAKAGLAVEPRAIVGGRCGHEEIGAGFRCPTWRTRSSRRAWRHRAARPPLAVLHRALFLGSYLAPGKRALAFSNDVARTADASAPSHGRTLARSDVPHAGRPGGLLGELLDILAWAAGMTCQPGAIPRSWQDRFVACCAGCRCPPRTSSPNGLCSYCCRAVSRRARILRATQAHGPPALAHRCSSTYSAPGGDSIPIKGRSPVCRTSAMSAAEAALVDLQRALVGSIRRREGRAAGVMLEDGREIEAGAGRYPATAKPTFLTFIDSDSSRASRSARPQQCGATAKAQPLYLQASAIQHI